MEVEGASSSERVKRRERNEESSWVQILVVLLISCKEILSSC